MAEKQLNKERIQGSSFNIGEGQSTSGKIFATLYLSVFFLVGLALSCLITSSFYATYEPYFRDETPCRIVSSQIIKPRKNSSEKELKIEYSYSYKSKSYNCDKLAVSRIYEYEFEDYLKKYPQGRKTKCYVNPEHPNKALLEREIDWSLLGFEIIPLVFIIASAVLIFLVWKKPGTHRCLLNPDDGTNNGAQDNKAALTPEKSNLPPFWVIFSFALGWNFITAFFIIVAFRSWTYGSPDWLLISSTIPFAIIGLITAVTAIYMFIRRKPGDSA